MSIDSVQSHSGAHSVSSRSESSRSGTGASRNAVPTPPVDATGPAQGSFGPALPTGPWSNQGASPTSGTAAAPANSFQKLAADIQAMLIQTQGTAATPAAAGGGTSAAGSATAVTPEQKVAADLQTLMSDLQANTTSNARTANVDPTGPAGPAEPHRHHHHHGGGGEASAATAVAGSSASSGTTARSAASGGQAVSQLFAAGIVQALRAYGGNTGSNTMSAPAV